MIPATAPCSVVFEFKPMEGAAVGPIVRKRVVFWNEDGDAVIIMDGRLSIPEHVGHVVRWWLDEDDPIVGVVPGGGWNVVHEEGNPSPVVAWTVTASGYGDAVIEAECGLESLASIAGVVRIQAPGMP